MKKIFSIFCIVSFLMFSSCAGQQFGQTEKGAVAGTALGAGLGAIIGDQTGHAGPGIAIGAATGALAGGLMGHTLESRDNKNQALRDRISINQRTLEENRRLIEELKRKGADVIGTERGVVVNLPDVLFEFNRADLTRDARITVSKIASVLRNTNRVFSIEGHTDAVGSVTYNKKLSLDRAESVALALERNGIRGDKMRVRGFGEGYPISTNNTTAGRARNRRVEVIIENY